MTPESDATQTYEPMAVVEKYETVIRYLYRIWPRHKLLRKSSVTAAKRKIANFARFGETEALAKFTASWRGHAAQADTCHLFNHLNDTHGLDLYQHPR